MDPPPAPTVWMSSIGARTGRPSISVPLVIFGTPSWTSETSDEVPPTSNVMMSG
jgi:hypothetical protein